MGAAGSGPQAAAPQIEFAADRAMYERQPNESDKAWAGFVAYRDLGEDRTIPKTAQALGKGPKYESILSQWCRKFGWRQRIIARDRDHDMEVRKAAVEDSSKAHREMLLVAMSMWKLAAKDLMRWHNKIEKAPKDQPQLSARDVQALADAGMKLHRLLMGEPDAIAEHRHEVTVEEERMSLRALLNDKEALKAMDLIAEKMEGGAQGNGNGSAASGMH